MLILPAFFAAGEVAILRLRPIRVDRLIQEKQSGANSVLRLQRRLKRTLTVCQLGITISLVALGWLSNGFTQLWGAPQGKIHVLLDLMIFLSVVMLGTLLSGLLPKAFVLNRPEKVALQISPLLEGVIRGMTPILFLLETLASSLLKLIGLNTQWDSLVSALSAGELETLIESGRVTGLHPDEKNILEGVFALRDTQVREVMVPRSGMVTLPRTVVFSELMKEVHLTRHARFLVTGESLDEILGVLDLRLLAEPISKGEMNPETALEKYIKPVPRVAETCTLEKLLPVIRQGNPFLLVVDEHGGTEGLITAADLTGEIVGDEMDPGIKEPILKNIDTSSRKWVAAGDLEIIELNRQLNIDLPENINHYTLAGFLLEKLQSVPVKGETVIDKGIIFEITSMKGPRIDLVRITLPQKLSQKQ
ncbi:CBS-domain containing hemolysin [Prochlorococcus sp. MIT 0601]|nr:CBS-domain containing hemolysin [Prochlorococcus sp. MIT 0601]